MEAPLTRYYTLDHTYNLKDICSMDGNYHCIEIVRYPSTGGPEYATRCVKCGVTLDETD